MNWFNDLNTFIKVAQKQSFVAASRELNQSTSAVTRQIKLLETHLETTLFSRTTRKVYLTDSGEYLLNLIYPLLNEWKDVYSQLLDFKYQPQGEISICFPPNIADIDLFAQMLSQFSKKYPNINLSIKTTHKPISLIHEKIDILIALEKYILEPQHTMRVKLFDYTYKCYAAPKYLKTHPEIMTPDDLAQHNCLIYSEDNLWTFNDKPYFVHGNLKSNSGGYLIQACILGHGILRIPEFMVKTQIEQGLLQEVLPGYTNPTYQFCLFYQKHEYKPRKISLINEFIQQYFSSNQMSFL